MKAKIKNMERVYYGKCEKCATEVGDVIDSELCKYTIFGWFLNPFLSDRPRTKCPNPNCDAKINLNGPAWKNKTE